LKAKEAKKTSRRRTGSAKAAAAGTEYPEARSPGRDKKALEKLKEAVQAGRRRDYKTAVLILQELLSSFDAPPDAYLFMGRSFHALKDYSRALAGFNDYVRLRPRSFQGYFFAGRSYLSLGMPHKALKLLRKALELNSADPFVLALLGIAYLKARHSRQAVEFLQQAVEAAPQNRRIYRAYINALLIRGIRLCRNEDFDLGLQMLRFVLENGGDNTLLRLELGRACREMDLPKEALEHYTQALASAPGDLRIRWYRASILMSLGETAGALDEIEHIRAVDSGLPDLPWNSELVDFYMIRSFLENGQWRRAADACHAWIKRRSPNPMIHAMYAEALRSLKDYGAALNHLDRACEIAPQDVQLWYAKILTAWEGENWGALGKALKTARSLEADKNIINRFSLLLEAKTGEDDKRIISLLQNAIRGIGPEPELMLPWGNIT
jgi:tetratricopeptide (TPR) repeat protein